MMEGKLQELKRQLAEVDDLNKANAVLVWDQNTYMPAGGAEARGRQLATLARLAQEKFIDPAIGRLLDELQPYADSLDYGSDDAALIRVTRRQYERELRVPPEFVGDMNNHLSQAFQVWSEARPANDFARVRPWLEKNLEYSRRLADFFPGYRHRIDPLIDYADYGMTAETIRPLFAELRAALTPLVQAITSRPPVDESCLHKHYPKEKQLAIGAQIAEQLGYDFKRGRLDLTHHPFETTFSVGDVRITTRVKENDLGECLYGIIHESGHAMYEQGLAPHLEGTPLAGGTSAGVHESQSRLWENVVGRSRGFVEYFFPQFKSAFPDQLDQVSVDEFYRAINTVQRSLIRTEADEVTYNLHVMLRFELEMDLLDGNISVGELPEAWRARFIQDFGIAPPDDKDGVLQDVHWYGGVIGGAFQGYTLGNILSGLFYQAALAAHPQIPDEIRSGQFSTLHNWLIENLYRHGSKFTAGELVERITGGPIRIGPYIEYLNRKYGDLYNL